MNYHVRKSSQGSSSRLKTLCLSGASILSLTALIGAEPVFAQSATATVEPQEVVVTARKKAENLQDVPLAITAVTAQELIATGTTSVEGITQLSPGVTYTSFGAEANAQIIIRGISDTTLGAATSSNVSVFLDGIYIKNTSAFDLSLGGVDRVEIVKGPQSTTYGRNAFMGAVNYVTATPGNTLHADAAYTVGDHGRNVGYASVSGPIIDGILKGSISGTYDSYDGYDHDKVTGTYTNGHDKKDVLAKLVFTPIANLAITGVLYHGDDTFTQPSDVSYAGNCGGPDDIVLYSFKTFGFQCGNLGKNQIGPYGADVPYETGLTRRVNHFHVDAKYTSDYGTVDVLAGGNSITTESITEFDATRFGVPFGTTNATTGVAGPTVLAESEFGTYQTERDASIEARYDSPQQYRARFSFGGYYYNNYSTLFNVYGVYAPSNVPAAYYLPAGATAGGVPAGYTVNSFAPTPDGRPTASFSAVKSAISDTSEFVSGEFDILKTLTLSEELRALSESVKQASSNRDGYSNSAALGGVDYQRAHFAPLTSRTTLSWKPTKDYNIYFSAANGEKSGGFNNATGADAIFAPETDWSYELGVKTTLLDHHLTLNADVFHTDISNLQAYGAGSTPNASGFTLSEVKNYGSVSEDGFELEAKYNTDFGLTLGGGLAIQDPRFGKDSFDNQDTFTSGATDIPASTNFGCAAIPSCAATRLVYLQTSTTGAQTVVPAGTAGAIQAINLKGLHLPFAADFTLNLNAEYRHPVTWSYLDGYMPKAEWFARADYRYEGKEYADVPNFAYVEPKNIVNLHAGIENYHWSVTLELLNAADDRTPIGAGLGALANATEGSAYITHPEAYLPDGRTFSARFAFHY